MNAVKKKPQALRQRKAVAPRQPANYQWHNGAEIEIALYAESLHKAAKTLGAQLDQSSDRKGAWDVGPVVSLYRQAAELQMKFLIGEGGRFLAAPTDHLTLCKTHSLRWLAQIVCQIIKAVRWEAEFKCAGITNLAEFSASISQLEEMEPVSAAIFGERTVSAAIFGERTKKNLGDVPAQLERSKVLDIMPRLDALLKLLAVTADGLAATADLMELGSDTSGTTSVIQ